MKYRASIEVKEDPIILLRSLGKEANPHATDRCKVSFIKNKQSLTVNIEAADSVALRASINSITKLFTVYEQLKTDN